MLSDFALQAAEYPLCRLLFVGRRAEPFGLLRQPQAGLRHVQEPLAPERIISQVLGAADILLGFASVFGWRAHGKLVSRC